MISMFTTIQQAAQSYYNTLPTDIGKAIATSAVLSFTASYIFMDIATARAGDFTVPLVCAAFASVASMIHALVEPFFRWAFVGYSHWPLELAKMVIVKSATYCAFLAFLPALRIHLVAQNRFIFCISSNFIVFLTQRGLYHHANTLNSYYISLL